MCNCHSYNADTGDDPEVILDPAPYFDFGKRLESVCIDACIADQVLALWKLGIWTVGACCGHGQRPPSVIIADKDDADKAVFLLSLEDSGRDWHVLSWVLCGRRDSEWLEYIWGRQ